MVKILYILIFICLYLPATGQQQDFEGTIVYQIKVRSKSPDISDASWERSLMMGDNVKVYIRHGFYRHTYSTEDVYFYPEDQKVYHRHKGVDTLFYTDYNQDTSKLINVWKEDGYSYVNGIQCRKLTIETDQAKLNYQYAPSLHMNPAFDAHNTADCFDAYAREAQSLFLALQYDGSIYSYTQTATQVQSQILDDSIFSLPDLPIRKYHFESIGTIPKFSGDIPAYTRFLETNLNAQLGPKYIKLPKGEQMATQTVKMRFIVNEEGMVKNIEVLNEREVHPKLADEAVRVMKKCPAWQPATLFGKPIVYWFKNSITFGVTK